jgi:4-diphosphocytidyl-2-C-methyl-D-erythritol kinase
MAIEKRIPVGGGLGGGSADAGAVLRALNALNPRPMTAADLLRVASTLGADVPFLTQDRSALGLGWGRGDRLLLLPPLPASAVWLLVPAAAVSTADAYRWLDESPRKPTHAAIEASQLGTWEGVARLAHNDFEPTVGQRVPVIGRLLANLRHPETLALLGAASTVVMSGSGSTVAVISGERPHTELQSPPLIAGVEVLETETSIFVEPVVLTH